MGQRAFVEKNVAGPFWQAACLKFQQETHSERQRERENESKKRRRERERERENEGKKRRREREKARETNKERERQRERKKDTLHLFFTLCFFPLPNISQKVTRVPVFQNHFENCSTAATTF
jgi:hypothetical protein